MIGFGAAISSQVNFTSALIYLRYFYGFWASFNYPGHLDGKTLVKVKNRLQLKMDCHQTNKLMKKIEAIIKPFKLDEVKDALDEIGIEEMTVSEVKAFGRPNVHVEVYRGTEFPVGSVPEIKIELMVAENQAEAAVAAIAKGARR